MGNQVGPGQRPAGDGKDKKDGDKGKSRKLEAAPASHVGRKKKKATGSQGAAKLPTIVPSTKCRLRLLKEERVKDFLLMEEEFIRTQEELKPAEDTNEDERTKVD